MHGDATAEEVEEHAVPIIATQCDGRRSRWESRGRGSKLSGVGETMSKTAALTRPRGPCEIGQGSRRRTGGASQHAVERALARRRGSRRSGLQGGRWRRCGMGRRSSSSVAVAAACWSSSKAELDRVGTAVGGWCFAEMSHPERETQLSSARALGSRRAQSPTTASRLVSPASLPHVLPPSPPLVSSAHVLHPTRACGFILDEECLDR